MQIRRYYIYIKSYKIHLTFPGCNFLLISIHVFCLREFEFFCFPKNIIPHSSNNHLFHWALEKLLHISELFEIMLRSYVINRPCELGLETENLDFCSALSYSRVKLGNYWHCLTYTINDFFLSVYLSVYCAATKKSH